MGLAHDQRHSVLIFLFFRHTDFVHPPTPPGVSARPQCALQDASSGTKYCVLVCQTITNEMSDMDHPQDIFLRGFIKADDDTLENGMCGHATCHEVQPGIGICTYDM